MSNTEKLVLLHSNDMHGDFLAEARDGSEVGGVSLLSGYIKQQRERSPGGCIFQDRSPSGPDRQYKTADIGNLSIKRTGEKRE